MDNKIESGRITKKGQVTIPVDIRKELNIEEGDRLEFIREQNGAYKVQVAKKKSIKNSLGKLKVSDILPFDEERKIAYDVNSRKNLLRDLDGETRS